MDAASSTYTGLSYLLRGFKMLNTKGLRIYVVIPLIINIVLYAGIFMLGIHEMNRLISWMQNWTPYWLHWLSWLLWLLFVLVCLIVMAYTYTFIANLVAGPFNSLLAEKAEELLTGKRISNESAWVVFVKLIPYALAQQMSMLGYYAPRAIVCAILFFIPVIQIFAAIIWFIFSAWTMALQYMAYPMENHQIPFRSMRMKLEQKRVINFGFGVIVMIVSMIPIVNLIVMPASVLGATLLWVENYRNNHLAVR